MFIEIDAPHYQQFRVQLNSMFALRHRVFCERLGWVNAKGSEEKDVFDNLSPIYIIDQQEDGSVTACVRLLPTTGPNMLRDVFPQLLHGAAAPEREDWMESSRFAVDTEALMAKGKHELCLTSFRLFLAMIEFGLSPGLSAIVTVTDLKIERLVRMAGWPTQRLGEPVKVGDVMAVAIAGEVSEAAWAAVMNKTHMQNAILYRPVLPLIQPSALAA